MTNIVIMSHLVTDNINPAKFIFGHEILEGELQLRRAGWSGIVPLLLLWILPTPSEETKTH